ncbi:hypothetical protein M2271_008233 [Streptomyces sp. LBL]|uniref:hypothetical protein n=1 Tax=Streptomyces sp. LBL TaxID=2940562 RepID=UPI0024762D36|nr:hypothetical protein [Streptomyces sp. LBL]MDH6630373.1 hypothetical protein [Streptomyces sp. LBL]
MYRLRRLRLENIGHAAAGFKSLTLDLTGGVSRIDGTAMSAVDVILWLRNGGGKSSLLSLFFSLFLPAKIDFIGHKKDKSLADYVPGAKTSHVIAEWENTSLPRGGPALITGGVYQWKDGHRPADPAVNWEQLVRRWYCLRPLPGVLDLESLPIRTEGGQLTQDAYLTALATAHKAQHGLHLHVAKDQTDWERLLTDLRLDPGVLRIQRNMNREEGGITDLFQFSTCEDFINFLIDLVCDPREPGLVRASLEEQADKLAERPSRETEAQFLATAALALKPVQEASDTAAALEDELGRQVAVARHAAERLSQRAIVLDRAAAEVSQQAQDADMQTQEAEKRTAQRERQLTVLTHQAAHWAVVEADEELLLCEQKEADATATCQAWGLVTPFLELEAQRQAVQELRDRLERQDTRQAPLRRTMETAGAALRDKLSDTVEEVARAAAEAKEDCQAATEQAAAAEADRTRAMEAIGQAKGRLHQTAQMLSAAENRLATAREGGLIGLLEEPGDALRRWEAERATTEERLARCRLRQAEAATQLSVFAKQQLANATRLAAAREQHSAEWERLGLLQAERRELAGEQRLLELACAADDTELDLDRVAQDLLDLLAAEGRQADAQLQKELQDAAEDQRAANALDRQGFLPPPVEVERAVKHLQEQDVPAVPGLQFLREAFPTHRHEEIIAAVPHLIGGVVVCGPVPDGDLAARVRRAGVSTAVITVSLDEQARQAVGSGGSCDALVLPVHPAVLEPAAAEREQERVRHRLAGLDRRKAGLVRQRETDAALAQRLQTHMDVFGGRARTALEDRVARLEEQVNALHDREQLLAEQVSATNGAADTAQAQSENLATELAELASRLPTVRQLAEEHTEQMPACRRDAQQAQEHLAQQQAAVLRHTQEYQAATAREQEGRDRHRRYRDRLRRCREQAQQLAATVPETCGHSLSAAALSATPLETLRERFDQARRDWQDEIGDDELRVRAQSCTARITVLVASLADASPEVRDEAAELAHSSRAGDADERARAQVGAEAFQRSAVELVGVAKHKKSQACSAREEARSAVERLDPPWDGPDESGGPFACSAETRAALKAAQESALHAREEVHARRLKASELQTATERVRNAAHAVGRCARAVTAAGQRCGIATPDGPLNAAEAARLDAALLELLSVGSSELATLSPEQADIMEQSVVNAVERAAEVREAARRKLEKSLRRVQLLAQDDAYANVVDGQLRERLLTDLGHPVRLAELIDDLDLREKVVADELAGLADDHLMVVQACGELVKTVLDDLQEVAQHSRLPQGLGSWSGKPFLSLEIRHMPDDEVLSRRVSVEVDRMIATVTSRPSTGKASALPAAMDLVKKLVLAALGGTGNVVAKIIKPTQSLDVVQHDSVTQIKKFSGGELLTVSVLLYCTLARLRAAKQGRRTSGGVGTLVLDNPFGKANYAPFISLQRRVAGAHGIQLVYTTGSNDLPALERFPLIIRLRNGTDARTRAQYVQIEGRYGDAVSRGLQHAYGSGITSAHLRRPDAEKTATGDPGAPSIPEQSSEPDLPGSEEQS